MKKENLKEIMELFESSSLAKMELEVDDMKVKLEKFPHNIVVPVESKQEVIAVNTPISNVVEEAIEEAGTWIKSPIVGTFYSARATGSTPFIEIGKQVKKGDVLCIIEAMKVMNEIHSPMDGIVQAILPTNESMVEFDQDLIRIGA